MDPPVSIRPMTARTGLKPRTASWLRSSAGEGLAARTCTAAGGMLETARVRQIRDQAVIVALRIVFGSVARFGGGGRCQVLDLALPRGPLLPVLEVGLAIGIQCWREWVWK